MFAKISSKLGKINERNDKELDKTLNFVLLSIKKQKQE
jgi:hypothetical protein